MPLMLEQTYPAAFAALFAVAPHLARLDWVDVLVIAIYFGSVIFIGLYLKSASNTSEEFFMAAREMTSWIAGLSFVSANLGSLELMGWGGVLASNGAIHQHGLRVPEDISVCTERHDGPVHALRGATGPCADARLPSLEYRVLPIPAPVRIVGARRDCIQFSGARTPVRLRNRELPRTGCLRRCGPSGTQNAHAIKRSARPHTGD